MKKPNVLSLAILKSGEVFDFNNQAINIPLDDYEFDKSGDFITGVVQGCGLNQDVLVSWRLAYKTDNVNNKIKERK